MTPSGARTRLRDGSRAKRSSLWGRSAGAHEHASGPASLAISGARARHRPSGRLRRPASIRCRLRSAHRGTRGDAAHVPGARQQPGLLRPRGARAALGAVASEPDRHAARPVRYRVANVTRRIPVGIRRDHPRSPARLWKRPVRRRAIALADLRRACEAQIKSHLVHLREGFIEAGGDPANIASLVAESSRAFTAPLRHVAVERRDGTGACRSRTGARAAGIANGIVGEMLALEQQAAMHSAIPPALPRLRRRRRATGALWTRGASSHEGHEVFGHKAQNTKITKISLFLSSVSFVAQPRALSGGGAAGAPELTQPVNDFAKVIDPESAAKMDELIRSLQRASGDVVVATIDTFMPYGDIREHEDVRETAGAASDRKARQRPVDPAGGQGSPGMGGSRLRPGRVHHGRLRGRAEPQGDGSGVSQRELWRGTLAGTSRIASRIAERRNVTLEGAHRQTATATTRASAARGSRPDRDPLPAQHDRAHAAPAALLGRPAVERLEQRRRAVRRRIWRARGGFGGGLADSGRRRRFGGFGGGRSGGGGGGGSW